MKRKGLGPGRTGEGRDGKGAPLGTDKIVKLQMFRAVRAVHTGHCARWKDCKEGMKKQAMELKHSSTFNIVKPRANVTVSNLSGRSLASNLGLCWERKEGRDHSGSRMRVALNVIILVPVRPSQLDPRLGPFGSGNAEQ